MKIIRWVIIMPVSIDKFEKAEDYTVAKRTLIECDEKGGIELQSKEPINNGYVAKRIYRCRDKMPQVIKWAMPKGSTSLTETCTSQFPKRVYEYTIAKYPDLLNMKEESYTKEYKYGDVICEDDNDLNYIDIINWDPQPKNRDWRIDGFECQEAQIQKLPKISKNNKKAIPEWVKTYKGPMTVTIKTLTVKVNIFGVGSTIETALCNTVMPNIIAETHRAIVGWSKEWSKMTREEIESYEKTSYQTVNQKLDQHKCC